METGRDEFLRGLARLHTTVLGEERIKRNLCLEEQNAVDWCRAAILSPDSAISRRGKNWYIRTDFCEITVNAGSLTIITAHRVKGGAPRREG